MNKQVSTVPKLRFPEFVKEGEWEVKVFDKVFDRLTSKNEENNQNVLTTSAQFGLVSQLDYFNKKIAAKDVSGYYLLHKGDFVYNKSYSKGYPMGAIKPLKLYDKGVVSTLYICFRANDGYNESFFEQYFDAGLLNNEIGKIAQEGGRAHGLLNVSIKEFFKDVYLLVPTPQEQQKIASCLSSLDALITTQTQKLQALQQHKKGLMQNLFPAEGKTIPKLRFPEFVKEGEWEVIPLKKLAGRVLLKNKGGEISRVFTNSAIHGIVDQREYFDKDIANQSNLENYYVVESGDYVYNPRISSAAPVGPTSKNKTSNIGVMSPLYTVFRFKNQKDGFYEYYFFSKDWHDKIRKASNTGARFDRMSITASVFMNIPVFAPSQKEQQKIADCLSSLDALITTQTQKLQALQQHKKGLMQQLFIGNKL